MKRNLKMSLMALAALAAAALGGEAEARMIHRQELVEAAQTPMQAAMTLAKPGLEPKAIYFARSLQLPDQGEWRLAVNPQDVDAEPGRRVIPVTVLLNGKPHLELTANVMVQQRERVLTLARNLARGEIVGPQDLRWEERVVNHKGMTYADDPAQLIGMAVKRPVRAGAPLKSDWFDRPIAIERGERVRVTAKSGALTIRAIAVADQAGRVGDAIAVRNPESSRRYLATVIAPGAVRVEML
ncbi:flagellar basal body P-ring formation chaperone FlgA [Magnetofaba australis]|uniref:Flagella basal body P-ring formation protein FlgA n=1 Tax=Magnetofaba australis IT-1 TaxID=1434232 RepID=A0A1Y2K5K8_9PROT|nr:flagellar basal body P-ring formation chaperone FlgA [Magnetofaba australis]OSM02394.1 putative flagellar basal body P-ring biosynthesis protein-like protein [Magnetofaba australis IT-1]